MQNLCFSEESIFMFKMLHRNIFYIERMGFKHQTWLYWTKNRLKLCFISIQYSLKGTADVILVLPKQYDFCTMNPRYMNT